MDTERTLKEIYFALHGELFQSLKTARKLISQQPFFINGKQVLDELLASEHGETFRQMVSEIQEDKLYQGSIKHGIDHNLRTSILAGYISIKEKLNQQDFRIIIAASMYHDIGRVADQETNNWHGERSSKQIDSLQLKDFSPEDISILKAIITAHSQDDPFMFPKFKLYHIKDINRAARLANILKDADALDRVRTLSGPDKKHLRTDTSKQLVLAAYEIYANINSIDGLPKEKWIDLDTYVNMMLTNNGCQTQFEHIRAKISTMPANEKANFISGLCTAGKKSFERAISVKDRIGIIGFDSTNSILDFCITPEERKNMETFLASRRQASDITAKVDQNRAPNTF